MSICVIFVNSHSIPKETLTDIIGTNLLIKSNMWRFSMWIMFKEENKQRKIMRFLFPEAVSKEAITREERAIQASITKHLKNEPIDFPFLEINRRA